MSHLIKEDDEFLYLKKYIHANDDSYSDWMMNSDLTYKYPEEILIADDGVGYEITILYKIRKSDAMVFIDDIEA